MFFRIVLLGLSLLVIVDGQAFATPVYNLPGFLDINICFQLSPGITECDGLTRAELLAQPDAAIPISSPGTRGILTGGLSDGAGDLGTGDEFFLLSLIPTPSSRFLLDSIFLFFDAGQPTRQEFPSGITATAGLQLGPGFGMADLSRAFGPIDGNFVEVVSGTLVFSFASSAPTPAPIPEPATLFLLGAGVAGLGGVIAWSSGRGGTPNSGLHRPRRTDH